MNGKYPSERKGKTYVFSCGHLSPVELSNCPDCKALLQKDLEIQQQQKRIKNALKHINWSVKLIENPSPRFVSTSGYLTGKQIRKILKLIKDAKISLAKLS